MRKIREVPRLRVEGFSEREIARSSGCARSSVQICLWRAEEARVFASRPYVPGTLVGVDVQVQRPGGDEVRFAVGIAAQSELGDPASIQRHG